MQSSSKRPRIPRIAAAASLLLGTAAQAGGHNFVLTAYTSGRGGQALIDSSNRCVTLTVTRQWDAARIACDRAVKDAERQRASVPTFESWARNIEDDHVAVALSNRAVLHWLTGDSDAAAADLKRAGKLSPRSTFVQRNESALEYSHEALARLDVASK